MFLAAAGLVLYAPLLAWHEEGVLAAFRYLAADAFYYLTIADHAARLGFFTFDGVHPTNGFQPLFQAFLRLAFAWTGGDREAQILVCFASSALATALGTGFFALAVLRATRSSSLALLAAVPGFYAWLVPSPHPEHDARWSFVNGMESGFSILFFGLLLWLVLARGWLRGSPGALRLAVTSLLLTLIAFTRLDEALLFVPFAAWLVLGERSRAGRLRRAAWLGVVPALCGSAYLAYNRATAGAALPLSGVAKLGVGGLLRNGYAVLTTLLPFGDVRAAGLGTWGSEVWRVEHMLVPALAAAAWLAWRRPRAWWPAQEEEYTRVVLSLLAVYVLLRSAFNFAFVPLWQQGSWYYPLCMLSFDLGVAVVAGDALRALGWRRRSRPWVPVAWCAVIAVAAASHASLLATSDRHATSFRLFEGREPLRHVLEQRCPGCGLLSFDDGLLAYALGLPTLNGLGLVLDREAFEARREGRLLPLAHARGHSLLATLHYPFAGEPGVVDLREALAAYPWLEGEDLAAWRFELVYRDAASGAVFVAFTPRAGAPAELR